MLRPELKQPKLKKAGHRAARISVASTGKDELQAWKAFKNPCDSPRSSNELGHKPEPTHTKKTHYRAYKPTQTMTSDGGLILKLHESSSESMAVSFRPSFQISTTGPEGDALLHCCLKTSFETLPAQAAPARCYHIKLLEAAK